MKSDALGSSAVFAITRSVTLSWLLSPPLENEGVAPDSRVVSEVQSHLNVLSQVALDKSLHLSVFDKGQGVAQQRQQMGICFTLPQVPHK